MQDDIDVVSKTAKATKAKLEALEKDNEVARQKKESGPGTCEDRTRSLSPTASSESSRT